MQTNPKFNEEDLLSELELTWLIRIMRGLGQNRQELNRVLYSAIREDIKDHPMFELIKLRDLKAYNKLLDDTILRIQSETGKHDKIAAKIAQKMEIYRKLVYEETTPSTPA